MASVISKATHNRLPVYLNYLQSLPAEEAHTSATAIAQALGMNDVQVRKDLAQVSASGRPRVGYVRTRLIAELREALGYDNVSSAVIVGAGKLGRALLDYSGFKDYGLEIVAAFDADERLHDASEGGKPILSMDRLDDVCRERSVHMGIIAVPAAHAQEVCDRLTGAGVLAIWNFAPYHLSVPPGILVQNENMAASLSLLSTHLKEALSTGTQGKAN